MTMKVGFILVTDKVSGGERYSLGLAGRLAAYGVEVTVVSNSTDLLATASHHGLQTKMIRLGPKLGRKSAVRVLLSSPSQRHRLRRLMRTVEVDAWLLQYKLEQMLWGGADVGKPVLLLEHGPIPKAVWHWPLRGHYAAAIAGAAATLAASGPAERALSAWGAQSVRINAGLGRGALDIAMRESLQAAGSSRTSGPRLVYAGRLVENKGLLRAVDYALQVPGATITIVGDGPLREQLARLGPRVILIGAVPSALPFIEGADAGVLLSNDPGEGRPLFGVECAALGVPLIANADSEACRALADELPTGYVRLVSGVEEFVAAVESPSSLARLEVTWDEGALAFMRVLHSSGNSM